MDHIIDEPLNADLVYVLSVPHLPYTARPHQAIHEYAVQAHSPASCGAKPAKHVGPLVLVTV